MPGAPGEPVQPQYPQSDPLAGYPPPQSGYTPGYPTPMPGGYPPGYGAAPPAKGSNTIKVLVGVLLVLVVIAIVGAALVFTFGKAATINVPTPPGWKSASEEVAADFEKEAEKGGQDVSVDYLFTDGTLGNSIAIGHGKAYIMDSPDGEDLESIEDFFMDNKSELVDQLESAYQMSGISLTLKVYAVEELSCGVPALFMSLMLSVQGSSASQDYMLCFKGKTMFFAVITKEGSKESQAEVDFLKENISFK